MPKCHTNIVTGFEEYLYGYCMDSGLGSPPKQLQYAYIYIYASAKFYNCSNYIYYTCFQQGAIFLRIRCLLGLMQLTSLYTDHNINFSCNMSSIHAWMCLLYSYTVWGVENLNIHLLKLAIYV